MKRTATLSLVLALSTSSIAWAQSNGMKPMDTKDGMGEHKCMDMNAMNGSGMKGMDMDSQKCKAMMNAMGGQHASNDAKAATHTTVAVVKAIDVANGKVTLAHDAVKSLNWPAMTMAFSVKDKTLFDKLVVGKKINVEFVKQGKDYVLTSVK